MSQMTIEFGVGKELRAARLKAELKVTDVAEQLNLRVEHITAIEKDNYADLPGATYVVGFVKSYARLLGLNDVHLIDRLMESGFIPSLAPVTGIVEDKVAEPTHKGFLSLLSLVLLMVAIAAVYFTFFVESSSVKIETTNVELSNLDTNTDKEDAPSKTDVSEIEEGQIPVPAKEGLIPLLVAAESKKVAEPIKDTAKDIKRKIVGTKPDGARVLLTAQQDAWYQVYNPRTNKKYLNAVLKSGQSVWLTSDPDALMDIGRPHKVLITIDGKEFGPAGPSWGGVIKKLSADGDFLIYDYFGKDLNNKSYNQWIRKNKQ